MLLDEAGLIEAQDLSNMSSDLEWQPKRLTWKGHEFIEAARSDTIWRTAKDKAARISGGVALEIMKELLIGIAREKLGIAA